MGLVLSRSIGQSVMIGDDIEIKVAAIGSGKARLFIVAPKDVPVHRREVWVKMQQKVEAPR